MYLITGATGNTGKPITLELLKAGKKVRIISRSKVKAKELTDKGAELYLGTWRDTNLLAKAIKDITAVYAMIPPDLKATDYFFHQKTYADSMAAAFTISDVKFVVSLSSIGAHLESGTGSILGLRYMEQKFNEVFGLNTLHIRASYFMENALGMINAIKHFNMFGSPIKADLKMNMVASKDIADYAAKRLLALDFFGHNVQYLLGQRDLTYSEVAKVLCTAIGKPDIPYTQIPDDDFKYVLMQGLGATENAVNSFIEFQRRLNEGTLLSDAKRDKESTTPTSIEEFSKTFAYVYNMK